MCVCEVLEGVYESERRRDEMIICIGPVCIPISAVLPFLFFFFKPFLQYLRTTRLSPYIFVHEEITTVKSEAKRSDSTNEVSGKVGMVTDVINEEHWESLLKSQNVIVVQFTASWCKPCKRIAPLFESLCEELSSESFRFIRVDIDELGEVAASAGILAIPAFAVYDIEGEKTDWLSGADSTKLEKLLRSAAANASTDSSKDQ